MKIIILGAGQVGSTVAQNLVLEHNDVTVVDSNPQVLQVLQDKYDLRTIAGVASHPSILRRAGAEDADMIVAVTNSDETNMIACQVAYTLFQTPTRIARLRSPDYLHETTLFREGAIPIDVLISPEKLVTDYIERLLQFPGTLQVLDFAGGLVQLVCVRAYSGSPMVGQQLRTLHERMPRIDLRVAAIYRHDHAIMPNGDTIVEADDEVFFVAARKDIRAVMREMRRQDKPVRRVMLAGGGNIGRGLALALEADYNTKLIESDPLRAQALSRDLKRTIVLQGDAADRELLLEENVEDVDVFCAVTNNDEANILSAMLAKRLGARKVMALINRTAYVDLIESGSIDIAISPQQITIGTLLAHVRRGDVVAVHSLRRGAAEAIEAIAHGDARTSRVVGRRIDQLALPSGITIGALVRGSEVIIAHDDIIIQSDDHVVLFLLDKKQIGEVERLFQVSITFI